MSHSRIFDSTPRGCEEIETKYRRISGPIPYPESSETLDLLKGYEPISMGGQPPIVWEKAEGFSVYDGAGNRWIDFSSGVLVANCGHAHPKLKAALIDQIENGVIFSYCFPNKPRAELVRRLVELVGGRIDRCFLLTTGAEATENAIKLMRTYGIQNGGPKRRVIVSFDGAFHGRTLGSQLAGGIPALKEWIAIENTGFVSVPFPGERAGANPDFSGFLKSLEEQGIAESEVCGVMAEAYQGGTGRFYPKKYMQDLRKWCDEHDVLLVSDEVQAGFGRTGKIFTYKHYDIEPDIICCGKGLSGSLPMSAVLGNSRFMSKYGPGEMTSTHSGSAICARAALTSLQIIEEEGLVENSRKLGEILEKSIRDLAAKHPDVISEVNGKGLMFAILFRDASGEPNGTFAMKVVDYCVHHGLMLYAPLGPGGGTVKINPPLVITEEALREGLTVFSDAVTASRD
jgi:4-aminobutyrate aminotransferase-like enzyme